jgi:hypothetical protein
LLAPRQTPSWRTTPWRLSAAAYSIYWQLTSNAGGRPFHPQPEDAPCCGDKATYLTWTVSLGQLVLSRVLWGRSGSHFSLIFLFCYPWLLSLVFLFPDITLTPLQLCISFVPSLLSLSLSHSCSLIIATSLNIPLCVSLS